jgi:hypothetical protein
MNAKLSLRKETLHRLSSNTQTAGPANNGVQGHDGDQMRSSLSTHLTTIWG